MGDFELDTRLEDLGDQRFRASLSDDWRTDTRIWSQSGRLLASGGAQLYCMPRQNQAG